MTQLWHVGLAVPDPRQGMAEVGAHDYHPEEAR